MWCPALLSPTHHFSSLHVSPYWLPGAQHQVPIVSDSLPPLIHGRAPWFLQQEEGAGLHACLPLRCRSCLAAAGRHGEERARPVLNHPPRDTRRQLLLVALPNVFFFFPLSLLHARTCVLALTHAQLAASA